MSQPIQIIQGAQWGSEAKGTIAAYLALKDNVQVAVRTGAINAGHTVYYQGNPYAMQQIPVAWVKLDCTLVIGAGAYIQPEVLAREIELVEKATGHSLKHRLYIDENAGLHLPEYAEGSKAVNRHHAIGATGKGCAEAIVHKIKDRNMGYQLFREWMRDQQAKKGPFRGLADHFSWSDTRARLIDAYHSGVKIQLEGTQGELLDFHFGPYPYTTSRQTIASAWVTEAGLPPSFDYETVLVARTCPIRVAGNSGPMGVDEITWVDLATSMNDRLRQFGMAPIIDKVDLDTWTKAMEQVAFKYGVPAYAVWSPGSLSTVERNKYREFLSEGAKEAFSIVGSATESRLRKLFEVTTVTKKLRRIAMMNRYQLRRTARDSDAAYMALTFLNYIFPEIANKRRGEIPLSQAREISIWLADLQDEIGCPIWIVNTGPLPEHIIDGRF